METPDASVGPLAPTGTDATGAAPAGDRPEPPAPSREATEPSHPPSGLASVAHRGWAAARAVLAREDRRWRLLFGIVLSAGFVALLLAYTRGGLLYAVNYFGIYSPGDLALRPRFDYLLPAVVAAILPGQYYAAFYLTLFLETALVVYAAQSFARTLFRRSFPAGDLRFAAAAAGFLYLFSPVLVTYASESLLAAVVPSAAAFFFVLRYLAEAARSGHEGTVFPRRHAVLLGLAAGLSLPSSLPDDARIAGMELAALVLLVLYLVWHARRLPEDRASARGTLVHVLGIALPIGVVLFLYPVYLFLSGTTGLSPSNVMSVAASFAPVFSSGPYNGLPETVRLLGRSTFTKLPYYGLYQSNPAVQLGSLLWPLLALAVPLVAAAFLRFRDRWLIVPVATVALLGVLWEAGTNPPFGGLYAAIAGRLPFGPILYQTYSVTSLLLGKLFPPLIAFAAVLLGRRFSRRVVPRETPEGLPADRDAREFRRGQRQAVGLAAAAALVVVASLAAWPIYDGAVAGQFGDPAQKGFFIPPEYRAVQARLGSADDGTLLLPQVGTYVRTSWGYNGANGFYLSYFYPAPVLVPGYFGPFGTDNAAAAARYAASTDPLGPAAENATLPPVHLVRTVNASEGGVRHVFGTHTPADLAGSSWLSLALPVTDAAAARTLLDAGDLWIGLGAPTSEGGDWDWFALGRGANTLPETIGPVEANLSVFLPSPVSGHINLTKVAFVSVWARENLSGAPPFSASLNWTAAAGSAVDPAWRALMGSEGMHYLLVDWSITRGAREPYAEVEAVVAALEAAGALTPVITGAYLSLYALAPAP